MIGRLVLSDRNIYKIKSGIKQISARKCNILSSQNPDILIKTSKEFNSRDEYIKFELSTNSIIEGLGQVGTDVADMDIYYHLFTLNWLSSSKYMKLWEEYINECVKADFDLVNNIELTRTEYKNQVITIDPKGSIDLDDGFSFVSNEMFYHLDIHIADPVSRFNLTDTKFKSIFDELINRLQSCYISKTDRPEYPTHLLPHNIVNLVSLLEIKSDSSIKSRRALSFCFKISKHTKQIVKFELKPTNLTNIVNYSYEMYDEFINSVFNVKKKTELVELTNLLVNIIGLNPLTYPQLTCSDNISHSMIEIFMILTNWWGGNYLLNTIKSNPILRTQNPNDLGSDFNISQIPEYARPFLSVSANYVNTFQSSLETEYTHYSLGISNYAHLSSPMRRFIDMVNHLRFYKQTLEIPFDLEQINTKIKTQKKISNAWKLVKFIKSNPESNKFKACLFDWVKNDKNDKNSKIMGLMVLYHQIDKFISIVSVELPQIDETSNLSKYMEWDVELYYNSNNFKSTKFPFSIKII